MALFQPQGLDAGHHALLIEADDDHLAFGDLGFEKRHRLGPLGDVVPRLLIEHADAGRRPKDFGHIVAGVFAGLDLRQLIRIGKVAPAVYAGRAGNNGKSHGGYAKAPQKRS